MIDVTKVNPHHPDGVQYRLTVDDEVGTKEELLDLLVRILVADA